MTKSELNALRKQELVDIVLDMEAKMIDKDACIEEGTKENLQLKEDKGKLNIECKGLKADIDKILNDNNRLKHDIEECHATVENYKEGMDNITTQLATANDAAHTFKNERDSARTYNYIMTAIAIIAIIAAIIF